MRAQPRIKQAGAVVVVLAVNVRPHTPVPLVSRPPSAAARTASAWWMCRRWQVAAGAVGFSLAGLVTLGTLHTRLMRNTSAPADPSPAAPLVIPVSTPVPAVQPAVTFTPTSTSAPTAVAAAPTSTPTLLNEGIAKALIERYYSLIDGRDFQGAYALLGAAWRGRQGFGDFAAGYRGTTRDTATVTGTAAASKGSLRGYVVAIDLDAQLSSGVRHYKGLYFVALEDGQARIQSGELSPQ